MRLRNLGLSARVLRSGWSGALSQLAVRPRSVVPQHRPIIHGGRSAIVLLIGLGAPNLESIIGMSCATARDHEHVHVLLVSLTG